MALEVTQRNVITNTITDLKQQLTEAEAALHEATKILDRDNAVSRPPTFLSHHELQSRAKAIGKLEALAEEISRAVITLDVVYDEVPELPVTGRYCENCLPRTLAAGLCDYTPEGESDEKSAWLCASCIPLLGASEPN